MKKVLVDVFGGDFSPTEILKGAIEALDENAQIGLVLSGDQKIIQDELAKLKYDQSRVEIIDAPDVISNNEMPTLAIKQKKNSSMVAAFDRLKNDDQILGMISAGSTGAVLTGSILKLGRIQGISRPALAPVMPTLNQSNVLFIDAGANVDCKPHFLAHFAIMGSTYMKRVLNIPNPRVGLLSVGTEDKKGNELSKAAFALLKTLPINFVGNLEAREVLSGDYDVVVADGFNGNICIKSIEGSIKLVFKSLVQEINKSFKAKMGALLMKSAFKRLKKRLDYTEYGGAIFMGVEKLVIKVHGSAKANTVKAAVLQVENIAKTNLVEMIKDDLSKIDLKINDTTNE